MFERRYFILAPNFHGATLLARLLNAHPQVVSLGDTYPSQHFDQVCGCGDKVSQCAFWRAVRADVMPERYSGRVHWLPAYPKIFGRGLDRLLYNALRPSALRHLVPHGARQTYADDFEAFLHSIHRYVQRPEARVFVDGVKSVARVFALLASGVQVDGVIHLYRAPGDYIKSTQKHAKDKNRRFLRSAIGYRMFHMHAHRSARYVPYISLAYECLAEHPEQTVHHVFQMMGVPLAPLSRLLAAEKGRPWHFMGNASLFEFDGTIQPSRYRLSRGEAFLVRMLAGRNQPERLHLAGRDT
jgi:hypothetical protein